jgi:hypothetical protein
MEEDQVESSKVREAVAVLGEMIGDVQGKQALSANG